MTIQVGQALPNVTLYEFIEEETPGCAVGPNAFQVADMVKGKTIVIFGLPGAYTPTCSAKHVPSYVQHNAALKTKGVDEVWCVSVNDAFVMGSWGRELGTKGKVRMFGDGNAEFSQAVDLTLDLTGRGMGIRSNRYAMLVKDGVVKALHVEEPGKFDVSSAEAMLALL
ncbi:MAG: peroxiredoxin [Burkholderiaceae bacterium]|jgi:glutaredoxin/glutathione-dependent peroxiredoxin|nr:peroxiredoxin [Burkholderiaceae bacterium]